MGIRGKNFVQRGSQIGAWLIIGWQGIVLNSCSIDDRNVQSRALTLGDEADAGPGVSRGGNANGGGTGGGQALSGTAGGTGSDVCEAPGCSGDVPFRAGDVDASVGNADVSATECPADNVCQEFDSECAPSWKPIARDGAACECDPTGCKLVAGEACTGSDLCTSADCRATNAGDNVCCAPGCGATDSCSPEGTSCQPTETCTEEERRCSGSVYQQCLDGIWTELTECAALGCDRELGGCLRSTGQTCATDSECGEGQCAATADGAQICCTANCAAICQRCSADGTSCENLADDEACGPVQCPADETCRAFAPNPDGQRCTQGSCRSPEDSCVSFPQNENSECSANSLCDAQGNCNRPKRTPGQACSTGVECLSGACVATSGGGSTCCNRACAANEICSTAGACVLAPVCVDNQTQCSGSSFQRCNGGQWATQFECGSLGCSEQRGGCFADTGDSCNGDNDCGVGRCQDSAVGRVCCSALCDGACRQCSPSGQSCENLNDDSACGVIDCPSDTTCRNFPQDVTSQRCIAGRCGSTAELCPGTPQAVGQVCSATSLCDNAGNCSQPKRQVGDSCNSGAECSSNFCVDGVCCNEDCNGTCETCSGSGICRAPADDNACPVVRCGLLDPQCASITSDIRTNRCQSKGVCATEDACGLTPQQTQCSFGTCDGAGLCQSPTVNCGGGCESSGVNDDGGLVCCAFSNPVETICTDSVECSPNGPTPISCDEHTDCLQGDVCCLAGNAQFSAISCRPQNDCLVPPSGAGVFRMVCRSPGTDFSPCLQGQSCVADEPGARLAGWSFCQ